jgi:hypothetical protein
MLNFLDNDSDDGSGFLLDGPDNAHQTLFLSVPRAKCLNADVLYLVKVEDIPPQQPSDILGEEPWDLNSSFRPSTNVWEIWKSEAMMEDLVKKMRATAKKLGTDGSPSDLVHLPNRDWANKGRQKVDSRPKSKTKPRAMTLGMESATAPAIESRATQDEKVGPARSVSVDVVENVGIGSKILGWFKGEDSIAKEIAEGGAAAMGARLTSDTTATRKTVTFAAPASPKPRTKSKSRSSAVQDPANVSMQAIEERRKVLNDFLTEIAEKQFELGVVLGMIATAGSPTTLLAVTPLPLYIHFF